MSMSAKITCTQPLSLRKTKCCPGPYNPNLTSAVNFNQTLQEIAVNQAKLNHSIVESTMICRNANGRLLKKKLKCRRLVQNWQNLLF